MDFLLFERKIQAFMRFRAQDRVDFRPLKEAAWIGAIIEKIDYENHPSPRLILVTDSFMWNEDDDVNGNGKKLTDRVCLNWEDVLHHLAIAGTHVKEDWRQHFQINHFIEFWDTSVNAYRVGKIVYYCISSKEICLVYHRFLGAPMESIVFPIASKMLRCAWDFFP
jgi:hypothetical protein